MYGSHAKTFLNAKSLITRKWRLDVKKLQLNLCRSIVWHFLLIGRHQSCKAKKFASSTWPHQFSKFIRMIYAQWYDGSSAILTSCGKNGACKLTQIALQKSARPIMISVDHWRLVKFGSQLRILLWSVFRTLLANFIILPVALRCWPSYVLSLLKGQQRQISDW